MAKIKNDGFTYRVAQSYAGENYTHQDFATFKDARRYFVAALKERGSHTEAYISLGRVSKHDANQMTSLASKSRHQCHVECAPCVLF